MANVETEKEIDLIWGEKIPMRDGINLNATIYKPHKMPEQLPVILPMTPYISDTYHERGMYFARNGYVFAIVDVRGRGSSEGEFAPLENDPNDGYDTVEWLAKQPWCNANVAMWGGSYAGYNQWATLKEFPPHLETIVPAAAAHPGVDMPFMNNIYYTYEMQWLTLVSGVTPNVNLFDESSFWIQKFCELYLNHRPLKELDQIVGNPSLNFQKNLEHPTPDEYWDKLAPSEDDYRKIKTPVLSITGHYDGDQPGAMAFYRRHMKYGNPEAVKNHYLIIGPWDHAGTRTTNKKVGGLTFGDACLIDLNKLHIEWYDWTMKDGEKSGFLKKRVAYYVIGSEEWKYANSLEDISNEKRRLFLDSADGMANDVFQSGIMTTEKPSLSTIDTYIYDPLDIRPAELERETIKDYILDQRIALNLFSNGLVYHSEAFDEATEISGYLKFVAWISMDVPDTDFQVSISEILPDGTSISLSDCLMRARYRESLRKEKLVTSGEINPYVFDSFMFFSRRIARGSRLRLVFKCPNSINLQKNYNSGGVVHDESGKDARTAHITLYHDAKYPSYLELPIVR
ncbi:MAG: CocE/NonD family hydrolase [Anaerolineaceae bacterium]|nr:CocE/NonD family hydrolase [Anaerolineaceae bacterium]